jgi:dTDP-4-dehydrorhamnose 3,5-epimerase
MRAMTVPPADTSPPAHPTAPGITTRTTETTAIDGLLVIRLREITDERGTIREFIRDSTRAAEFPEVGAWRQINVTESAHGAIRGLHGEAMTKLVGIISGAAFGVYVDTRADSATRGAVATVPLTKGTQVLVPAGVCNGFQCLSPDGCQYLYCFDDEWVPGMAGVAVNPLDPALGVVWPVPVDVENRAQVSAKDAGLPSLADVLG